MLWRTVSWRTSLLVTLGAALMITVSLGPMAEELGRFSAVVWLAIALVGALQCLLLAELAARMPGRAGGTATYVHAAVGKRAPILGAASSWGYWFAWTPGIAVNLILAATYLRETVWSGISTLGFALVIGAALYALNALGLRTSMRAAAIAALLALVPLLALVVGVIANPSLLDFDRLTPMSVPDHSWTASATWLLLAKWMFVAAWAAYGAEMASTVVAEMRDPAEKAPRAMKIAAAMGVVVFGVLPFLMLALVGAGGLTEDPLVVFLPVAETVFGDAGRTLIGLMLTGALVLGAQAFMVGSSRTIYQMTRDGYMPRAFARLNSRGVPIGSIGCDAAVILLVLLIFGTDVVDVVASANVGYLIVFVLLPIAYIVLRRGDAGGEGYRLGRGAVALAGTLSVFNAVLLVVGGSQWGPKVVLTGALVMAAIVPVMLLRRWEDRRGGRTQLLRFPAGEPHDPAEDTALQEPVPAA
jgi:amino acid transporter